MNNIWRVLSLLLLSLFLFGCQPTTTYYLGAKADADWVASLASNQVESQRWDDLYVLIDYNFKLDGDSFDLTGELSFSDGAKINYFQVNDFRLKLFLLDANQLVVDYFDIARALGGSVDDRVKFSWQGQIKKDVVAFTFGYEGDFIESDPDSTGVNQVWKLPKRDF